MFRLTLNEVHPISMGLEAMALKSTIDTTCNDYFQLSWFDVFTRLFQPWSTLNPLGRSWRSPWLCGLPYDEVKARLHRHINKPGSYVGQDRSARGWASGQSATSRRTATSRHYFLRTSLTSFTRWVSRGILPISGREEHQPVPVWAVQATQGHVKVTQEQYELYCGDGLTFQLLQKICAEQ